MTATVASLLLALLALSAPAAAGTSGLRGVVEKGPITPVCKVGTPCDAPAGHVTLTFTRGSFARHVTTASDGRYRIALPPGTYAVSVSVRRANFSPRTATVPVGRVVTRNFTIDTGIR